MDIQIRHNPSFSVVRATLAAGEQISAESGAMMAMTPGVSLDARIEGGLLKGLKRSVLGGESLFITKATAGADGDWIDFAASLPGDAAVVDLNEPMLIQRGSYLCSGGGVEIDTKWGGLKTMVGGEGLFLLRATGRGSVALSAYGALDRIALGRGEQVIVDTNHMVAFAESVTMRLIKASESAWKSLKSGEGLVFEFTGPGDVLAQSRNPDEMIKYVYANWPGSRS